MAKLASVQKIEKLTPIDGADMIETATVLGWEIVVKKGEFKVGDLVSYIQIDTVVPDRIEFEFLRERKFRVKTIKLRKQVSQGLIIPLPSSSKKWKVDDDLTEILGITKYEKPDNNPDIYDVPKMPKVWYKKLYYIFLYRYLYNWFPNLQKPTRSGFPTHLVPITDEERIQNIPKVLETHKGKSFVVSYKLDGSSITIIHEKKFGKHIFRICSRKFELKNKNNDWYKVFESNNFGDEIVKLVDYYHTDNIIVQGEAIGKFNGNHHALDHNEIRLFNIYVDGVRINQRDFIHTCVLLNIPHCPVYQEIVLNHTMQEIIEVSKIKDILNPKVEVEGLVWRSVDDNLSFKVINNNYLLKHE